MSWNIIFTEIAFKCLKKLDRSISKEVKNYIKHRIANLDDPRSTGSGLTHDKSGLWRHRFRDYRIICEIRDKEIQIIVIKIGHRKDIYE